MSIASPRSQHARDDKATRRIISIRILIRLSNRLRFPSFDTHTLGRSMTDGEYYIYIIDRSHRITDHRRCELRNCSRNKNDWNFAGSNDCIIAIRNTGITSGIHIEIFRRSRATDCRVNARAIGKNCKIPALPALRTSRRSPWLPGSPSISYARGRPGEPWPTIACLCVMLYRQSATRAAVRAHVSFVFYVRIAFRRSGGAEARNSCPQSE